MAASFVDQPQSAVMLKQAENGSGQITLDACYVAMTLCDYISIFIIHSKYFPVSDWLKPHA